MTSPCRAIIQRLADQLQEYINYVAFIGPCDQEQALVDEARALLAQSEPEGSYIHYDWELHDAEGEWQAGGSADSLEDVQREGNRYLQTYSQDGPHNLIIQRHCVSTIEETTNG